MTEETYTLAEAKLELARRECRTRGHSFEFHMVLSKDGPERVICTNCGRMWPVGEGSGG